MDTVSTVLFLISGVLFTIYSGWLYRHGEKDQMLVTLGLNKNKGAVFAVKAIGLMVASGFTWMFSLMALVLLTRKSFFGHYSQYRVGATILTLALIYLLLLKKKQPEQVCPIINSQDQQ